MIKRPPILLLVFVAALLTANAAALARSAACLTGIVIDRTGPPRSPLLSAPAVGKQGVPTGFLEHAFDWATREYPTAVATVLVVVLTLTKLIELAAKANEAWKDSGLAGILRRRDILTTRRRRLFCKVLDSDLATLAKAEQWNDQYFADLEAEVEAEGKYYGSPLRRLLRRPSHGLRRVRSLIGALESSAEQVLLLVGEPGSGKSVALRHVAQQLARRGTRSSDPKALVPLYLNLKELKASSTSTPPTADSIKQFVLDNIRRGDSDTTKYVSDNWADFRDRGIWFFLFDSFDEIPAVLHAPTGSRVIQDYAEAIRQFLAGMSACRGVLASREFKGPDSLPWQKLRILPLSEERQHQLVASSFLDRGQRSLVHQHLAKHESSLLGSNPLFLTLLCRYVREEGQPPASDYDLLAHHIRRLAHRDADYVRRTYGLSTDDLFGGAERIALLFAETPELSLAPTFDDILAALGSDAITSEDLQNLLAALVDVKIGRSDVREARTGDRRFTFSHRRYQETLFVGYLASHPAHIPPRELLTDPRWREYTVTLLQTHDADILKPLLDEAAQLLAEAAARQRRQPVREEFNSHLSYFCWEDEPLAPLLSLLQEGLARREPVLWAGLATEIVRTLDSRWHEGDLYDRLRVLEFSALLPSQVLADRIAFAIDIGAGRLQAAAFQKVEMLRELSPRLAEWVRERLSAAIFRASEKSDLRRLEALAARLPAKTMARAVVSRHRLFCTITTPLWLLAFPFAMLNLNPLLAILTGAVAGGAALLRPVTTTGRMLSLIIANFWLNAPRLAPFLDKDAVVGHVPVPPWLVQGFLLWFLLALGVYSLRSFGSILSRDSFLRFLPTFGDFLVLLCIVLGFVVYLTLRSLHYRDSRGDVLLDTVFVMLTLFVLYTGAPVARAWTRAVNRSAQLRQAGMADIRGLLQARTRLELSWFTFSLLEPQTVLDEASVRSLSRLALDPSLPPPEHLTWDTRHLGGRPAMLEALHQWTDRALESIQLAGRPVMVLPASPFFPRQKSSR
jgi:hypothetical protein